MNNIIELTTPKNEKVILNFDNVVYCHKTHNNHTSLKFNYSLGSNNKSAYLVVKEDYDTILMKLGLSISGNC